MNPKFVLKDAVFDYIRHNSQRVSLKEMRISIEQKYGVDLYNSKNEIKKYISEAQQIAQSNISKPQKQTQKKPEKVVKKEKKRKNEEPETKQKKLQKTSKNETSPQSESPGFSTKKFDFLEEKVSIPQFYPMNSSRAQKCIRHPSTDSIKFCMKDLMPICSVCVTDHKEHTVVSIEDATFKMKSKLRELDLKKIRVDFECKELEIQKTIDALEEQKKNLKDYQKVVDDTYKIIDSPANIENITNFIKFWESDCRDFASKRLYSIDAYDENSVVKEVERFMNSKIQLVKSGFHHTFVLCENKVFATGINNDGQLGIGNWEKQKDFVEVKIPGDHIVSKIACGSFHTMLLTETGKLFVCGNNKYGQLGIGNNKNQKSFQELIIANEVILNIAAGANFSVVVTATKVYSFGYNSSGRLGLGDTNDRNVPTEIVQLQNKKIKQISLGHMHCLALCDDGEVLGWGSNKHSQLGFKEPTDDLLTPFIMLNETNINQVSAGEDFSILLVDDMVYMTDQNLPSTEAFTFKKIEKLTHVVKIDAIGKHFIVLTANGKICLWGEKGPRMIETVYNVLDVVCGKKDTYIVTEANKY
eukprot:gene8332-156_t